MKKKYRSAIILCGGKGSRLGDTGRRLPKTLIKIQKKPILWYIINELIRHGGFNHFILPVGHKGEMVQSYIKKKFKIKKYTKIKFDIVKTGINTSISKIIFKVADKIVSDNFLLLNGDAIFSFNLKHFFSKHKKKVIDLTMFTCEVTSPFGVIVTKKDIPLNFKRDMIYDSINNSKHLLAGKIYTGMSIIKTKLLRDIKYKNSKNFEMNFYPKVIKSKKNYKSEYKKIKGFWYAMDDLKQVQFANTNIKENSISNKINKIKKYLNDK